MSLSAHTSSQSIAYSLIIVESHAKCKTIENYLGPGYKCIASFGHIRELPHIHNIDIDGGFIPTYNIIKSKSDRVKQIKMLAKDKLCTEVIIATDNDREGEAIGWHLCQVLGLNIDTTKRLIFHEISLQAISFAIANPTIINMALVQAQQCRQIMDVLVGFTVSPVLWSAFKN